MLLGKDMPHKQAGKPCYQSPGGMHEAVLAACQALCCMSIEVTAVASLHHVKCALTTAHTELYWVSPCSRFSLADVVNHQSD